MNINEVELTIFYINEDPMLELLLDLLEYTIFSSNTYQSFYSTRLSDNSVSYRSRLRNSVVAWLCILGQFKHVSL